jgi:ABC-type branched-subunit amino acid transport system ATPase component
MADRRTALLELRDVTVEFGGLRAVDRVSMQIEEGGIVGLIGPNGAGKTTLIDAVTGFVPITGGWINFAGERISQLPAHRRVRRGLSRTFQSLELFEDLTVAENVQVPTEIDRWWRHLADVFRPVQPVRDAKVTWALEGLELSEVADEAPRALPQRDRKRLAIARALASTPSLLLLDEPAAGLDEAGTDELEVRLRGLATKGTTILLVDHDMALVLNVCDYVYVLDAGRLIAAGTPAAVRNNATVLRSYLGEETTAERVNRAEAG